MLLAMSTPWYRLLFKLTLALALPFALATVHHRPRGQLRPTVRQPSTCDCALGPAPKSTSRCYYIKNPDTGECASRICRPSYECQSVRTGLICMKRVITERVIPVDFQRCERKQVAGVMYVPYTGGTSPQSQSGTQPRDRMSELADEQAKLEREYDELHERESAEKEKIRRLEDERIEEIRNLEKTRSDEQAEKGNEQALVTEMQDTEEELEMVKDTARNGLSDHYIVVAGKMALGRYENLDEAKAKLKEFHRRSKRGRSVFAVRDGQVLRDPRRIDGVRQSWKNGFNKFWWGQRDIDRMRRVAVAYNARLDRAKLAAEKRARYAGTHILSYVVVTGKRFRGEFDALDDAKHALLMSKPRKSKQRRAIFEVVDGKVVPDVTIVGGEMQEYGMKTGFNKFWWDQKDIDAMYDVAVAHAGAKRGAR